MISARLTVYAILGALVFQAGALSGAYWLGYRAGSNAKELTHAEQLSKQRAEADRQSAALESDLATLSGQYTALLADYRALGADPCVLDERVRNIWNRANSGEPDVPMR